MRKVAGYIRVSKLEQEQDRASESLKTQRTRIETYYDDVEIFKIYDKDAGKTAAIKDEDIDVNIIGEQLIATLEISRPDLIQLIRDADKGLFTEVLITRWDRWSRSTMMRTLLVLFLARKGIVVTPTDDVKDPLVTKIKSVLDEEEVRRVSRRTNLTIKRKFKDGIIVGKPPYGYKVVLKNKRNVIVLDKKKAENVRKAFELTAAGHKYDAICNALKIPIATYYRLIKNPTYTGKVVYKGKVKDGTHEPIVSQELFDKVN